MEGISVARIYQWKGTWPTLWLGCITSAEIIYKYNDQSARYLFTIIVSNNICDDIIAPYFCWPSNLINICQQPKPDPIPQAPQCSPCSTVCSAAPCSASPSSSKKQDSSAAPSYSSSQASSLSWPAGCTCCMGARRIRMWSGLSDVFWGPSGKNTSGSSRAAISFCWVLYLWIWSSINSTR